MHKVEVRRGFTGPHRQRAGISVTHTEPYEGELTADQLKAIEADAELVVTEVKAEKQGREGTTRKMVDKPKSKGAK